MCAAWLTIWSKAKSAKLIVISSTTGRSPVMAAPTPTPTIVFSEIGVSRPGHPVQDVHVVVERLGRGQGRGLGEGDRRVHAGGGLGVDRLALVAREDALGFEPVRERRDRVARTPLGDLLLCAVLLRVGHRV